MTTFEEKFPSIMLEKMGKQWWEISAIPMELVERNCLDQQKVREFIKRIQYLDNEEIGWVLEDAEKELGL